MILYKNLFIIKVYSLKTKEKARKYMKKLEFFKGKAKAIFAGTFLAGIIFTGNVFATTELKVDTSVAFDEWNKLSSEAKDQTAMPRTYDVEIPDSILNKYDYDSMPQVLNQLLGNSVNPLSKVGSVHDSRFNLAEELDLRVEHQQNTTECWAFSLIKAVETNKALQSGIREMEDFSERHMDYATSRNFLDGTNEAGFNRDVGNGGLLVVGLAYLTNGQGAVLEQDMPFKNEEKKISLSEIDKDVDTIVNDYYNFPTVHKEYERDAKGNTVSVKYKKANGSLYTESELEALRNMIKEHLVENGAIASMTGGNYTEYYNNSNAFKATAYNCNTNTRIRDHAITIVGWDDNYPKENFGDGRMPSTDGAYIVLNSYGETSFDGGYIYISYEDFFIEEELYGVGSTGNVDYDKLYQNDYYGGIYRIGLDTQLTGSIGTSYDRDKSKKEILESIGVNISNYANIEVYVNPEDSSFATSKLVKVAETTEVLYPGFHRVDITPIELTGESFAIVVKQKSESGGFYFQIEANISNSAYSLVESENRSYISLHGNTWTNITNLNVSGIDMTKADVCIKAYTVEDEVVIPDEPTDEPTEEPENPEGTEPSDKPNDPKPENPEGTEPSDKPNDPKPENPEGTEPSDKPNDPKPENPEGTEPSDKPNDPKPEEPEDPKPSDKPDDTEPEEKIEITTNYTIKDGYIMNVDFNTTKEKALSNIKVNAGKNIINSDGSSVDDDELVKTGMKLRLSDGSIYVIIVRGDINMDGLLSLIDLSKILLHYNGVKGFELNGDALKGADMNLDEKVSLVDVSQMIVLYNSI